MTMTIADRDKRLAEIFSKDVLGQFDEAEKNVLSEEFANSELRLLASQDVQVIKARVKVHLAEEFKRRLTHIQPEEYELLKPWYIENAKTLDEIICSKCGALLGIEIDTIDDSINPYHHEGKFVVPIGDKLYAYRPRLDGQMGYQCGNPIEDEEAVARVQKYSDELEAAEAEHKKALKEYEKVLDKWVKEDAAAGEKGKKFTKKFPEPPQKKLPKPIDMTTLRLCGNDTRWSQIELDNVPESHVMTSITKEDMIKVKQEMDATNYVPDVKENKRGKTIESFELRKVK
jgi:hypothetical protein